MTTAVETSLEGYALEKELSQNNWFILYQGYRRHNNSPVLIKIATSLLAGDDFLSHRFKHLTRQAAQLEHPNIVPAYEVEQQGELLFAVQDFEPTSTLAEILEAEGPFSLQRTQFIVGQIASALDYAHQKSLPHGDLSAQQIYIGPNDRVFIGNFGQSQAILGSKLMPPDFNFVAAETIAPERVNGQGPSRPADLYALGILCYQMLAKKPPFSGPVSSVLYAQAHKQPPPLHQVNPAIPLAVSEVVGRMLSKSVDVRYNTGAEFVRALTMAYRLQGSTRQYDYLVPITERERPKPVSFTTAFRFLMVVVLSLLMTTLSAWAGYELGRKQQQTTAVSYSATQHLVTGSTIPISTETPETQLVASEIFTPGSGITMPSPSQQQLSDTLSLGETVLSNTLLLTTTPILTPSPTLVLPRATPTLPPTPVPALPEGQALLAFHNPTGHDLIVDLTGPTSTSALVPPGQRHEFLLQPGAYQYIVHTPTGRWLESVVGYFDLASGQILERDYYSDHN